MNCRARTSKRSGTRTYNWSCPYTYSYSYTYTVKRRRGEAGTCTCTCTSTCTGTGYGYRRIGPVRTGPARVSEEGGTGGGCTSSRRRSPDGGREERASWVFRERGDRWLRGDRQPADGLDGLLQQVREHRDDFFVRARRILYGLDQFHQGHGSNLAHVAPTCDAGRTEAVRPAR